jgi:cytochrome c oxidase subunit 3
MADVTTDAPSSHGEGHHDHPSFLAHHFDTPEQQFDAAKLGMWIFIATEILMFGGLFVAYFLFKGQEPAIFHAGAKHLDKRLGAFNTVVLLFSSLTAALAVRSSQEARREVGGALWKKKNQETTLYLTITLLCAGAFLVVKYFEYTHKFHDGLLPGQCFGYEWCHRDAAHIVHETLHELPARAHMYFAVYFMTTGLHALHILIGMSVLAWVLLRNMRGEFSSEYFTPVEIGALYWHLVDLVWIYLFPLLYLVG